MTPTVQFMHSKQQRSANINFATITVELLIKQRTCLFSFNRQLTLLALLSLQRQPNRSAGELLQLPLRKRYEGPGLQRY